MKTNCGHDRNYTKVCRTSENVNNWHCEGVLGFGMTQMIDTSTWTFYASAVYNHAGTNATRRRARCKGGRAQMTYHIRGVGTSSESIVVQHVVQHRMWDQLAHVNPSSQCLKTKQKTRNLVVRHSRHAAQSMTK